MDDNLPLKYTFSYSPGSGTLESLVYFGENSFSPNVTFPTGQEENNTLIFVVLVTDSLDASTLVQLKVQVSPCHFSVQLYARFPLGDCFRANQQKANVIGWG
jgi:hypothetical protein